MYIVPNYLILGTLLLYSPELYKFIKSIIELILYLLLIVSETYTHCELLYKYIYNINILYKGAMQKRDTNIKK